MRTLTISVIAAWAAITAAACGGDSFTAANQEPGSDAAPDGSGGTAGVGGGGTGGTAGIDGSSGTGGTAGESGSSGTGGAAGSGGEGGTAGTAGLAGSAGDGGSAGTAGSAGSEDAGTEAGDDAGEDGDTGTDAAEEADSPSDAPEEPDAAEEADAPTDGPEDTATEEAAPPLCQNGETESCYSGPPATEGVAACKAGTKTCQGGAWSGCVGEVLPKPEICDWEDDDCNGVTDDIGSATPVALTAVAGASAPSVAYAGGALGLSWTRPESGKDQVWFGTANPATGARLVADKKVPNASGAESREGVIAGNGGAFSIGMIDTLPIAPHAAMASADQNGTVEKNASTIPDGGGPENAAIAVGNGATMVVYDANGLLSRDIYFALWSGGNLAAHGTVVSGAVNQDSRHPAAVWSGTQYLVFWTRDPGPKIVARTISGSGSPGGNVLQTNGSDGFQPSPVWTPSGPAFSWRATDYGAIRLTRLDQNLASPLTTTVVSVSGASYQFADLGWSGTDFAVAWVEISGGTRSVKAARIKADGSIVSLTILISAAGNPGTVRIAPTGASWSVVWDADGAGGRQLYWSSFCK